MKPLVKHNVLDINVINQILFYLRKTREVIQPSTWPPPIRKTVPIYYYFCCSEDINPARNLCQYSIGCWETKDPIHTKLLSLLKPIHEAYLLQHQASQLDSYGLCPEDGRFSRYTINNYGENGYLDFHTDTHNDWHPFQMLTTLSNSLDHILEIKENNKVLQMSSEFVPVGSSIFFDATQPHRVIPKKPIKDTFVELKSTNINRVDCAYINISPQGTDYLMSR